MHLSATANFLVSYGSLTVLLTTPQDCRTKQGRKAAATNFRHVHFLCDLFAFSQTYDSRKTHKAVARQLQDTQGVRTTDVIVRQPRICLTSAARLPQGNRELYSKAAQECPEMHSCSARHVRRIVLSCDSLVTFA